MNHTYTRNTREKKLREARSFFFSFFFLYNLDGSATRLFFLHHCTTFSIFFLFFPGYIILFHKKKYISCLFEFFFLFLFLSPSNIYILHHITHTLIYKKKDFSDVCGLFYAYIKRSWPPSFNQSKKKKENLYVIQQDISLSFVIIFESIHLL